ncbi:MAG: phenylacetate-CoA oxygenase subunit PaaC [Chitinophagales bacterium]|jgi:ring-1,2-phenylacetyl-CoA epoxidase subunit PaaC|nr:phenylacetate-CoA oxygenase subunit PaaC [Chitinophagales bacterium]HNL06062.1 phenylacetate-CoA oxygenase subunit PaaC [Chitinophagales bacterium]
MTQTAIKDLLYKMGDDALILGHRNSEWTGIGPTLEEDIAFSSMAQDKLGHALACYTILHEHLGEPNPDTITFGRTAQDFRCSHLVAIPTTDYEIALVRHFLYDHAEILRYQLLQQSTFRPLAQLATKIKGELKYHVLHADTWIKQLGNANDETAQMRLQTALNELWAYALGIFEPSEHEALLQTEGVFVGEAKLQDSWYESIKHILTQTNLQIPSIETTPIYGGRKAYPSEHLAPLLQEMASVYQLDPTAEW